MRPPQPVLPLAFGHAGLHLHDLVGMRAQVQRQRIAGRDGLRVRSGLHQHADVGEDRQLALIVERLHLRHRVVQAERSLRGVGDAEQLVLRQRQGRRALPRRRRTARCRSGTTTLCPSLPPNMKRQTSAL